MRSLLLIALLAFTLVSAKPRQKNDSKRVQRSTCSQSYTASSGVIKSDNIYGRRGFDNSVDCSYTIVTGRDATVYITIDQMDIVRESSCDYDSLTIGANTPHPRKLCGIEQGTFIYDSVQGSLVLDFQSAGSFTSKFQVSYRVTNKRCSVTYKEDSGVITSPRFGLIDKYPTRTFCQYDIETGAGKADVTLVLKHFDIESSFGCIWDYLQIENGQLPQSQKLCGTKTPGTTYTIRNVEGSLILMFYSDVIVTKSGFLIQYQVRRNNSSLPSWITTTTSWNNIVS